MYVYQDEIALDIIVQFQLNEMGIRWLKNQGTHIRATFSSAQIENTTSYRMPLATVISHMHHLLDDFTSPFVENCFRYGPSSRQLATFQLVEIKLNAIGVAWLANGPVHEVGWYENSHSEQRPSSYRIPLWVLIRTMGAMISLNNSPLDGLVKVIPPDPDVVKNSVFRQEIGVSALPSIEL